MPRKIVNQLLTPMRSLIEQFNEKFGKDSAKIVSDDGDSFVVELKDENSIKDLKKFIKASTKKTVIIEQIENPFSRNYMARIFFEKNIASEAIEKLMKYDEGTPPKHPEPCGDGCGSKDL